MFQGDSFLWDFLGMGGFIILLGSRLSFEYCVFHFDKPGLAVIITAVDNSKAFQFFHLQE